MYDLTILSIFRQSETYLKQYIDQVKEVLLINGGICNVIWLEGDSTDNTYNILKQAKDVIESETCHKVNLIKFNINGHYWPSIQHPARWLQLATCWNKCIDHLEPSRITMCVESDIQYDPSVVHKLIAKIDNNHNVIFPMLMIKGGIENTKKEWFYDTWGFSRGGSKFNNLEPYWSMDEDLIEEDELLQVATGGGMVLSTYNYQSITRFDTQTCILNFNPGIKLFMDKTIKIYHPAPKNLNWAI